MFPVFVKIRGILIALLKILRIWLVIDFIILLIIWFFNKFIRLRFPKWWRRHIVDEDVELRDYRWSMPEVMRRWFNRNGDGRP